MAGRKGLDTKDAIENWRLLLIKERESPGVWEEKWGMFAAPKRESRHERRKAEALAQSASSPALATASLEVVQRAAESSSLGGGSFTSASGIIVPPDSDFMNDRHKLMYKKRLLPRERYHGKLITTNQRVGWLPNLETLGVAEYGTKKLNKDLFPEDM
mmetsp:Transcript_63788/g.103327  ORF Transcript_63788/g.103327 Transcript_63788/m.103327 type:complete len:158 (+) Transcript_63788:66-539(+)|eukprot:CAMPEP_0115107808 /NCGR_PEP_ID=MMETSP0227-20121206/37548_1 /TAXON_ID=89957 /ORGANISM="Polarella glacialis, Strain CCMP 1383" /LENGTH=157 /DNA_ID=CAMNT_0002505821 /DNA_START=88 /DNA_END=561 /DNA_ORIENTATION=-